MIDATVAEMYRDDEANQFLEVTYQNGDREIMYFKDFSSGAMIENIVRRAKKLAIKRLIGGGSGGIGIEDLVAAIHQEYKEHEDLPNTTNPDDWAKISGKKGERIVYVRTLVTSHKHGRRTAGRPGHRAGRHRPVPVITAATGAVPGAGGGEVVTGRRQRPTPAFARSRRSVFDGPMVPQERGAGLALRRANPPSTQIVSPVT